MRGGWCSGAIHRCGADVRRRALERNCPRGTIRALLTRPEKARSDKADTAEAEYAADGHPVRINLNWDKNAIDDEALYVISS
ncbi:DUF6174 domain-containing protein [Streptomyces sp. NPDC050549]|uniref:DUF6174 domain-containing protein n=1 Tax=Streptomyces sp. NPDC050549 TaxID=3155406 RepID=UPI0034174296